MPSKTMHLLEGESLLNDASGLVALKFAVAATLTAGSFSWENAAKDFTWMSVGGLGLGALMGWGFSRGRDMVTRRVGDVAATQMVLLLILLPFASYIMGEYIGVSGILSAVAAGIATNFADLDRSNFISERLQTEGTWSMVEAAFNGAIFLLLGLQLPSIIGETLRGAAHRDVWLLLGYVAAISCALLALRWAWLMLGVRSCAAQGAPPRPHGRAPQRLAHPGHHRGGHSRCGDAGRCAVDSHPFGQWPRVPGAQPAHLFGHRDDFVHPGAGQHRAAAVAAPHAAWWRTPRPSTKSAWRAPPPARRPLPAWP